MAEKRLKSPQKRFFAILRCSDGTQAATFGYRVELQNRILALIPSFMGVVRARKGVSTLTWFLNTILPSMRWEGVGYRGGTPGNYLYGLVVSPPCHMSKNRFFHFGRDLFWDGQNGRKTTENAPKNRF